MHDWLVRARLAWDETRHLALCALRTTAPAPAPNTIQLEDRVLLSVSPGPMVADVDPANMDQASDLLAPTTADAKPDAISNTDLTAPDELRTAADAFALLDTLIDDVYPAVEQADGLRDGMLVDASNADQALVTQAGNVESPVVRQETVPPSSDGLTESFSIEGTGERAGRHDVASRTGDPRPERAELRITARSAGRTAGCCSPDGVGDP